MFPSLHSFLGVYRPESTKTIIKIGRFLINIDTEQAMYLSCKTLQITFRWFYRYEL